MTEFTSSGNDIQVTVHSGDTVTVVNGGTVTRATVQVAGRLVFSSATVGSNVADSGTVDSYAPLQGTAVASGGVLSLHPTGYDILGNGQRFTSATGTTISAGGLEIIGDAGDPSDFIGAFDVGALIYGGRQVVLQNGRSVSATVLTSGSVIVSSGGVASASDVAYGNLIVSAGGFASGALVEATGQMAVSSGGLATSSLISGQLTEFGSGQTNSAIGGTVIVGSGGIESSLRVLAGAHATVSSGGAVSGAILAAGTTFQASYGGFPVYESGGPRAVLTVQSGGSADGVYIQSSDMTVFRGGMASNVTIAQLHFSTSPDDGRGTLTVLGTATGVEVGHIFQDGIAYAGDLTVGSGGTVSGLTMTVGSVTVSAGGSVVGVGQSNNYFHGTFLTSSPVIDYGSIVLRPGDVLSKLSVLSGGVVSVASGATLAGVVSSGGTAHFDGAYTAGLAFSGGTQELAGGASVSGAVLAAGGLATMALLSGGSATATTVSSGGLQVLTSGTAAGTVISTGGQQFVVTGQASGTVVKAGGALVLAGGRADAATVSAGGVLRLTQAVASGTVLLSGAVASAGYGAQLQGSVVSNGGLVTVLDGGIASASLVSSGGEEDIASGATATGTQILGGTQVVSSGGVTSGVALSGNKGRQVLSGGTSFGTVLSSDGLTQSVKAGVASGTVVSGGGQVIDGSAASAVATQVAPNGSQYLFNGTVSGTTLSGGTQFLEGGIASATTVLSGGIETVDSGGRAVATTVSSGGRMVLSSGATADMFTVYGGGTLRIETASPGVGTVSGGTVEVAGVVAAGSLNFIGGSEILLSGASIANTRITGAGLAALSVSSGATASNLTVSSGGALTVFSGGITSSGRVAAGGTQIVSPGGIATDPTIGTGGTLVDNGSVVFGSTNTFLGSLSGSGTVTVSAGTLSLSGTNPFSGTISVGSRATLALSGGQAAGSGTIRLTAGAKLDIRGPATPTEAISGFTSGTILDIEALAYSPANQAVFAGGTLTVTSLGVVDTFSLPDVPDGTLFSTSQDTTGGTQVQQVVCFARGTLIRTEAGEIPVEHLRPGDRVITLSGAQPMLWLGILSFRRPPVGLLPPAAWPVRIAAGAFAPGTPHTDLLVSREHALYHDGLLIPAGALANGTTIRPEPVAEIDYFHVELPSHDVVFANGLASESWLDCGNRPMFTNAPPGCIGTTDPRPDPAALGCCAPRDCGGPIVETLREQLRLRAETFGHTYTFDADLQVLADGVPLPQAGPDDWFLLPEGAREITLRSRTGVPAEHNATSYDRRRLGLLLGGIAVAAENTTRHVPLDDAALREGFSGLEHHDGQAVRWTTGEAVLAASAWAGLQGKLRLRLDVKRVHPSWAE